MNYAMEVVPNIKEAFKERKKKLDRTQREALNEKIKKEEIKGATKVV